MRFIGHLSYSQDLDLALWPAQFPSNRGSIARARIYSSYSCTRLREGEGHALPEKQHLLVLGFGYWAWPAHQLAIQFYDFILPSSYKGLQHLPICACVF